MTHCWTPSFASAFLFPINMRNAKLTSRPRPEMKECRMPEPGIHSLGISSKRVSARAGRAGGGSHEALMLVPKNLRLPAPLMLMLHGAGGNSGVIDLVEKEAEKQGVVVVAPVSQGNSWDIISFNDFGPDVALIDKVLAAVFEKFPVDPRRLAAAGFSDGASYALSIGVANPDLFSSILAFSPGFMRWPSSDRDELMKPVRIYISHGKADRVLDVDWCSRRLVALLRRQGFPVNYTEFEDGHTVPSSVVQEGIEFMLHESN